MPAARQQLELVLDLGAERDRARRYFRDNPDVLVGVFLQAFPARAERSLPADYRDLPLKNFLLTPITLAAGVGVALSTQPTSRTPAEAGGLRNLLDELHRHDVAHDSGTPAPPPLPSDNSTFPEDISDNEAVRIAYRHELQDIARYLKHDLSVLVICDKILTAHIFETVCARAGRVPVLEDAPVEENKPSTGARLDRALKGSGDPAANLAVRIRNLKEREVLVLRGLDLLDNAALIEVLYQGGRGPRRPQLLGFLDPSLEVKKVLTDRFAVHQRIQGLPRSIRPDDGPDVSTVTRLLTNRERQCFGRLDAEGLYKNVAGLNAIQFRDAMRYVGATVGAGSDARTINGVIRQFKRSSSNEIEIPDTTFDQIGGYESVKEELRRTLAVVSGRIEGLDEATRKRLIPRGFIFHGPPGTGKTLFAKAIANEMNATIQMVSGPEIMDKYVGQSESNLRHLFATARRNAPSVIFFDEFDSIASQRSTYSDGGSRANNAVVAQLLTELDGFQEERAVLVIGTTNRLDIIDEALLRPSRLKPIAIEKPDFHARRGVAALHANHFGVAEQLRDLTRLVCEHLRAWTPGTNVPTAFLDALFRRQPLYRQLHDDQTRRARFLRELQEFIALVNQAQTSGPPEDARLLALRQQLRRIAQSHGLDPDAPRVPESDALQTDLRDLLNLLDGRNGRAFGADEFVGAVLDMVAEYTEDFNNDEIRAIFQESSFDRQMRGELITPRSLGVKIGLLRKRRDERTVTHLGRDRARR